MKTALWMAGILKGAFSLGATPPPSAPSAHQGWPPENAPRFEERALRLHRGGVPEGSLQARPGRGQEAPAGLVAGRKLAAARLGTCQLMLGSGCWRRAAGLWHLFASFRVGGFRHGR